MKPGGFSDLDRVLSADRKDYAWGRLRRKELAAAPIDQFTKWFRDGLRLKARGMNAMHLSTCTRTGRPSSRMMLLKGFDARGFLFFTNYRSRKGKEIFENPRAALVFYWPEMERQVRITGPVKRIPRRESEAYFRTRPRDAQIGAWVSNQSRPVADRSVLEKRFERFSARFRGCAVPLPFFWGGFRLRPAEFEFWQGRENRLNDRFRYRPSKGRWKIERLEP